MENIYTNKKLFLKIMLFATAFIFLYIAYTRLFLGVNEIKPTGETFNFDKLAIRTNQNDWPHWRGLNRDNISKSFFDTSFLKTKEKANWTINLNGKGHASPIGINNNIFLLDGNEQQNKISILCFDALSGNNLWTKIVDENGLMKKHVKNSHVSATPVSNGTHIFAVYPSQGGIWATCLSITGELIWKSEVGPFVSEWGFGSSPILIDNLLVVCADNRGSKIGRLKATSYIAAINIETGKLFWRTRRPEERSYGTPSVLNFDGRKEVIVAGYGGVSSYDIQSGNLVWQYDEKIERTANTITVNKNRIVVTYNQPQKATFCLERTTSPPFVRKDWESKVFGADVPTPIIEDDKLFLIEDTGQLYSIKALTGEVIKKIKVTRKQVSSSPLVLGNELLILDEGGFIISINKNLDEYSVKSRNMGDPFYASPILLGKNLVIRSESNLWSFGKN